MNKIYTVALLLLLSLNSSSQVKIKGRVIDSHTKQPLEFASISTPDNLLNTVLSDKEGYFLLNLKKPQEVVNISYVGYTSINQVIEANNDLKVELIPSSANLKDIVLNSTASQVKFNSIVKVDLDAKPVSNSQELLRVVPGLFVAQHAGGGKAEQIFLRGFDCDHGTDIQIAVDGMPVNMVSHAHGQGYADAHFIIPETINNIDYGTGPYYANQGNFNTAGYVNFSTFRSISSSRFQIEAGRFNTYRALAMVDLLKKNKEKQTAYIASEYNYTDGPTQNAQAFNRFNIFGKYNLAISPSTSLSVSASAFKSKWNASGQIPERLVASGSLDRFGSLDPTEGGNTERYNGSINLTKKFNNNLLWEQQAFYSRYAFNLYSNFTFFLNDEENGDGIQQAESRNIFGYNTKLQKKYFGNTWTLQSTYGAAVRHDDVKDSYLASQVKRQFISYKQRGDIVESNISGFTQQQLSIGRWQVEAGVRYDMLHFNYKNKLESQQMPSQTAGIVSPKLNIQYSLQKDVQLYVKAGKGFHSNDARVVVAQSGREILPAAYGGDIGIILKPSSKLLLNIAAWYLHLDQEFVYVGDEGVVEPSGQTRRKGIDVIGRYQLNNNLYVNANLNITDAKAKGEPKGNNYIPLAPLLTSTGGIYYKKKEGINGGISYRFIKDRPANEDNSITAKGYLILDGSINFTKPKYEIGMVAENLLNTKWNEAQFATESRLKDEPASVTELHYTPGMPFFMKVKFAVFF